MRLAAVIFPIFQLTHGAVHFNIARESNRHEYLEKRQIGASVSLENLVSYYRTELRIGNPPQSVAVQVDTGSSDLWVISASNPLCGPSAEGGKFNENLSASFSPNISSDFFIAYGDGTFAKGIYAQDTISFGEDPVDHELRKKCQNDAVFYPGLDTLKDSQPGTFQGHPRSSSSSVLELSNANFAIAQTANSTEAVWGIGMETTESMARNYDAEGHVFPTYANIPIQMKEQGYIKSVAYSLWLNDLTASSGALLFGGVDHSKYVGVLQKVPLVRSNPDVPIPVDFSVMLHGISAYDGSSASVSLLRCSTPVLLDSGTTYSQLPMEFLEPIMDTLNAVFYEKDRVFLVSEAQRNAMRGGGLTFDLSGIEISVGFDELLIPAGPYPSITSPAAFAEATRVKTADCISRDGLPKSDDASGQPLSGESEKALQARHDSEYYYLIGLFPRYSGASILGDSFLRSAYVVYDLERKEIALAHTNPQIVDPDVEEIDDNGIPSATNAPSYSSTSVAATISTHANRSFYSDPGVVTSKGEFSAFPLMCAGSLSGHLSPKHSSLGLGVNYPAGSNAWHPQSPGITHNGAIAVPYHTGSKLLAYIAYVVYIII